MKITAIIVLLLVIVNGYLLLKSNDVILKKYSLHDAQAAAEKEYEKVLEKDAVVSALNEHYIAAPVQAIREVLVTKGQSVDELSELALFKPEQAERELTNLENELTAYNKELDELETILSQLESETKESEPYTSSDSTVFGDDESWQVDLTLELGIDPSTPTAEGIAMIQRSMAETQRQIEILQKRMDQLDENGTLTSPIQGIVKDIILEGDSITFHILSNDKKLVVYVNQKEWQDIEVGQPVEYTFDESIADDQILDGTVLEKQQIPAIESIAYEEMNKHQKLKPKETVYEVSIDASNMETLTEIPIGTFAQARITTHSVDNNFAVREDWLVQYEGQDIEDQQYVYVVGYDGRTSLQPAEVAFKDKAKIVNDKPPVIEVSEDETDKETDDVKKARIETVQLMDSTKEQVKEEKLEDIAVISGMDEAYQIFINNKEKNLSAPTFQSYPFHKFDSSNIDKSWKEMLNIFCNGCNR